MARGRGAARGPDDDRRSVSASASRSATPPPGTDLGARDAVSGGVAGDGASPGHGTSRGHGADRNADRGDRGPDDGGRAGHEREPAPDDPSAAGEPGTPAEPDGPAEPDEDDLTRAAAGALARAREAARAKGLRPGTRPAPRRRRRTEAVFSGSADDARDPHLLGDQLDRLLLDRGWKVDVAAGSIMGRWPVIVGIDVARHCSPVTFEDGILTVRADSTAWATQLRLMIPALLERCAAEAGPGVVTELRITGPAAPSWSRGPRRAKGQGPRDTYG